MASTAAPARAVARIWQWKWRIGVLALVVGLTALALFLSASKSQQPATTTLLTAKPIIAQASVRPADERKLGFPTPGRIKQVMVSTGNKVKVGDVLATLDTADLDLKVQEARANLTLQQALVAQSADPPRSADLAASQSAIDSAIARQNLVASGPAPADVKVAQEAVAAAQAGLDSAQAQLRKIEAPPTASDLAADDAAVQDAQTQLAMAQQKLSEAKGRPLSQDVAAATLAVEQARDALWGQQTTRDAACGTVGANSAQCHSADANVGAAQTAVGVAQANLDKAKLPATNEELTADQQAIQSATAGRTSAQAQLARLKDGPTAADRDGAQAQVDQAAANLRSAQDRLQQAQNGPTAADQQAARNGVDQARAGLDKLTADPSAATIAVSKAKIEQAQIQLAEAEQARSSAVIQAPFDGEVTSTSLKAGDVTSAGVTVLTVADLSTLHLETTDLDEISAASVAVGEPVEVTFPAQGNKIIAGTVSSLNVEPTITASGDVNYVATIALTNPPPTLRWGQTARVQFK
jgi:HlyD family secretion protein